MLKNIGRYQIKGELGRGGMATVYRALDPNFSRDVAVKVLPAHFLHDPSFRDRFMAEARTIATLEHPAIVPVYDFGTNTQGGGEPFIVMRLLEGGSLRDRLDRQGALPLAEAARILSRLAPALDFAHKRGVIHRDLKPGNIMFDSEGEPYLADFGIARLAEATQTMTIVGTPAFMSPEQWEGNRKLDGRSDLYALGVVVFEMITGRMPFVSDTPAGLMRAHLLEPIPDILKYKGDLPIRCQPVIEKALAKNREDRYQTAESMATAVKLLASGQELPPHLTLNLPKEKPAPILNQSTGSAAAAPPSSGGPGTLAVGPPQPPTTGAGAAPVAKAKSRWWLWMIGLVGLVTVGACIFFVVLSGALSALTEPTATPRILPTPTATVSLVRDGGTTLPLGYDTAYTGWLPPDAKIAFTVDVTQDQHVLLVATSPSETDLVLTIYNAQGEEVDQVDYVLGDQAEVIPFLPERDATYVVELSSYDGSAGEYLVGYGELTLTAENVILAESNTINKGGSISYDLSAEANQALLFFVVPEGEDADFLFYLEDTFGNELFFVDDYVEGEWEAYLYYPERHNQYRLFVEPFDQGGAYQVYVVRLPVTTLN
ncbi:MAG: serine/threonine protein kinase [Anaerolineales bacterium]|nr:serine/threonine protein kinase [Anaerolineales bacterium]